MSMLGVWLLPTADYVVVAIVSCGFGVVVFPWFWVASWLLRLLGLLLSCFGHARAKNNSEALFNLNYVLPFVWGCHPVVFLFLTEL